MKVIDPVKKPGFVQWCKKFVRKVLAKIKYKIHGREIKTVTIVGLDEYYFYIDADNTPLVIRIWNYLPCEKDECGDICSEMVTYSLFLNAPDFTGFDKCEICGVRAALSSGTIKIKWSNDPDKAEKEIKQYRKLHGIS